MPSYTVRIQEVRDLAVRVKAPNLRAAKKRAINRRGAPIRTTRTVTDAWENPT